MLKRSMRILLSFLLAAFFLYLFAHNLDFGQLVDHVTEAKPSWLALAVLMQIVHLVVRCLRWRILLAPIKPGIRFYSLFSATSIGYLVTMLLPLRLGEILRPVMLGRKENVSKSGAIATCVLERLMDMLTVALLLGVYLLFFFEPPAVASTILDVTNLRRFGLLIGLGTLALFPILFLVVHYRHRLLDRLTRKHGEDSSLLRILHSFLGGFDAVKGGWVFTLAWIQSIAIWLVITASIWASLEAFDIRIGFANCLLMMALLTVGIAVPTQGGVGTYEFAGKLGLVEFFGIEPNRAAATILVTHIFAVTPSILIGIALLWKEGLSLGALSRITKEAVSVRPEGASR